jgi:hypothetical protein
MSCLLLTQSRVSFSSRVWSSNSHFQYKGNWSYKGELKPQDAQGILGNIITSALGDSFGLSDSFANAKLTSKEGSNIILSVF